MSVEEQADPNAQQSQVDENPPVQDGGGDDKKPAETALDAFARGVEEARVAEGGTPPAAAAEPTEATPAATDEKAAEPKAELTPEQKAEAEHKAALDKEIKDLGLKEKKAERFRTLEAGYREAQQLKKEIEPMRAKVAQLDQFNEILKDTGATPDQLSSMFSIVKRSNSGDITQMRSALKEVLDYAAELAHIVGEPIPERSPIDAHPDLVERINTGELTRESALEIVRARATETRTREAAAARQAQQAQASEIKAAQDTAIAQLNTLGQSLKDTDPHYDHKVKTMLETGAIDLIKRLPPDQWQDAFKDAYSRIKGPPPKPKPTAMPMRPTGAAPSNMQPKPKSAVEAFSFGVEEARAAGH